MIDQWQLSIDACYQALGVDAIFTASTGLTAECELRVIDKTAGVAVSLGQFDVDTIHPAAVVRFYELEWHGIRRSDLDRSAIQFNGRSWTVRTHRLQPAPTGVSRGEVLLILTGEGLAQ